MKTALGAHTFPQGILNPLWRTVTASTQDAKIEGDPLASHRDRLIFPFTDFMISGLRQIIFSASSASRQ